MDNTKFTGKPMPRSGEKTKEKITKEKILDAAHALVMGHGLAGTSIDMVLAKAEITKGAFFYHYKTKADLAQALVQRYSDRDAAHLEATLEQAERLSHDPLQQILGFISLLQDEVEQVIDPAAGCLIASYVYQFEDLAPEIRTISAESFLRWRQRLGAKFEAAIAQHPPRYPVTADSLADALVSVFEGGFVMTRVLQDPTQLAQQLAHYRYYIELLGDTSRAEI